MPPSSQMDATIVKDLTAAIISAAKCKASYATSIVCATFANVVLILQAVLSRYAQQARAIIPLPSINTHTLPAVQAIRCPAHLCDCHPA